MMADDFQTNNAMSAGDPEYETRGKSTMKNEEAANQIAQPKPGWLTVEPILCLYVLAGGIIYPAGAQLWLDKVCHEHYSSNLCASLDNGSYPKEEKIVQKELAYWFLWEHYCFEIPAILSAFVYGTISDRYSRKLAIAVPCMGQTFYAICLIINERFYNLNSGFLLIGSVVSGLTGGWITIYMSCFSYIAAITTTENRTKRILIAEGVSGLATALSLAMSGVFLYYTSYLIVFSVSGGTFLATLVYTLLIKEPPRDSQNIRPESQPPCCAKLKQITIGRIITLFKTRENNGRRKLLVTFLISFTSMVSSKAMTSLAFLYVKRSPLSWNEEEYGYFLALIFFIPNVFLLCVIPFIKSRLELSDCTLWIIGIISTSLSELWFGFSTKSWMVYLVPVIGCLRNMSNVARALLSKLVHQDELGNIFAILAAVQSISGMVGASIYPVVYPATLSFWPGICFVAGAFLSVIPISLLCWLKRDMNRQGYELVNGTDNDEPWHFPINS